MSNYWEGPNKDEITILRETETIYQYANEYLDTRAMAQQINQYQLIKENPGILKVANNYGNEQLNCNGIYSQRLLSSRKRHRVSNTTIISKVR